MLSIISRSLVSALIIAALIPALLLMPMVPASGSDLEQDIESLSGQLDEKKSEASQAEDEVADLQSQLNQVIREYQRSQAQLAKVQTQITKTQARLDAAIQKQKEYQFKLNEITNFTYRHGDTFFLEVILGTSDFRNLLTRLDFLVRISENDSRILKGAKQTRANVSAEKQSLEEQKDEQKLLVAQVAREQGDISRLLQTQQSTLSALESDIAGLEEEKSQKEEARKKELEELARLELARNVGSSDYSGGIIPMVFPVQRPYASGYTNDWGFPRAGNPAGHQGTDIFAQKGTPLVAVANGTIGSMFGSSGMGGYRLHVISDSGIDFYYAHLNNDSPGTDDGQGGSSTAYAPGIAPGVRVSPGQVVGYVGDSGDAESTPPHVHFGIYINGSPINPYPHLIAAN